MISIREKIYSKAFEDGINYAIQKLFAEEEESKVKNFLKKYGIEYDNSFKGIIAGGKNNDFNGRLETSIDVDLLSPKTIYKRSLEELTKITELVNKSGTGTKPKNSFDRLWNFAGRKTNETAERENLIKFLEETRNSRNKRNNDLVESNPDWISPRSSSEYKNGSTIAVLEGNGGNKNGSNPEKIAHIVETG